MKKNLNTNIILKSDRINEKCNYTLKKDKITNNKMNEPKKHPFTRIIKNYELDLDISFDNQSFFNDNVLSNEELNLDFSTSIKNEINLKKDN